MKNIIGKILHELLSEKGAPTKKDFAEMLGVSVKTLYNVIDGSSELTINQISKASNILNHNIIEEYNTRSGGNEVAASSSFTNESPKQSQQQATLTMNFGIMPSSYNYIAAFMNEINAVADKYGIKVL